MISRLREGCLGAQTIAWIRVDKRAGDSQDGKLAGSNNEYRRKHEANAGSKHGQGSEKQAAKNEEPVPPTHCGYWSAQIDMIHGHVEGKLAACRMVTQELPCRHIDGCCAAGLGMQEQMTH